MQENGWVGSGINLAHKNISSICVKGGADVKIECELTVSVLLGDGYVTHAL